jgi:hypothetical protein
VGLDTLAGARYSTTEEFAGARYSTTEKEHHPNRWSSSRRGTRRRIETHHEWRISIPPSNLYLSTVSFRERAGILGAMGKLIFDNRFIAVLFIALLFVNAFAIQYGWYGA